MKQIGYKTDLGKCLCGDSLKLITTLDDESINLIITSPPFALQRQKTYGNEKQESYVDWFCQFAKLLYNKLAENGSFVIDIGGAYEKGAPAYSLYQFKVLVKLCDDLGYKLAQPFYWHNPSALPAPIEWVNKKKIRAKTSVNTIWWLCKNPRECKADIRNVLTPYSLRMQHLLSKPDDFLKDDGTLRPSGHVLGKASWSKNNGGAIPPNLLQISNSESNSQYLRFCKQFGVPSHPARFPTGIPEFFIKFLTEKGDLVLDIFSGSNTTGYVCENLSRKWLAFELSQEYVAGSVFRFTKTEDIAIRRFNEILEGQFVDIKNDKYGELFVSS